MPWRVGIDENGLGPQLGPMIVTAVMARVTDNANRRVRSDGCSYLHERLNDSKELVNCRNIALGEAWARAVSQAEAEPPATPRELFERLSLRSRAQLTSRCPQTAYPQCWNELGEGFEADEARMQTANSDLRSLRRRGVDVAWVRTVVICARSLNEARRAGVTRFHSDLHAMEDLILAAREAAGSEAEYVCGKVGGLRKYVPAFSRLSDRLHVVLQEDPDNSAYRFPGLGTVQFVENADGQDPLVALASLVGKYIRELLMRRITRYYRRDMPELDEASGYNDPVTARFVRATRQRRAELEVPDTCFRREQGPEDR